MKDQEIEAIRHAFGLDQITDPAVVRAEIESRLSKMNALDRAAVMMKIGTRIGELEAAQPGAKYSPPTWTLIATALLLAGLAAGATYVVLATSLWLMLKIALGIMGFVWFLMSWRAVARVVFRLANDRDI